MCESMQRRCVCACAERQNEKHVLLACIFPHVCLTQTILLILFRLVDAVDVCTEVCMYALSAVDTCREVC